MHIGICAYGCIMRNNGCEIFLDQFELKRCKTLFETRMPQMAFRKYLDTLTSVCSSLEVLFCHLI